VSLRSVRRSRLLSGVSNAARLWPGPGARASHRGALICAPQRAAATSTAPRHHTRASIAPRQAPRARAYRRTLLTHRGMPARSSFARRPGPRLLARRSRAPGRAPRAAQRRRREARTAVASHCRRTLNGVECTGHCCAPAPAHKPGRALPGQLTTPARRHQSLARVSPRAPRLTSTQGTPSPRPAIALSCPSAVPLLILRGARLGPPPSLSPRAPSRGAPRHKQITAGAASPRFDPRRHPRGGGQGALKSSSAAALPRLASPPLAARRRLSRHTVHGPPPLCLPLSLARPATRLSWRARDHPHRDSATCPL